MSWIKGFGVKKLSVGFLLKAVRLTFLFIDEYIFLCDLLKMWIYLRGSTCLQMVLFCDNGLFFIKTMFVLILVFFCILIECYLSAVKKLFIKRPNLKVSPYMIDNCFLMIVCSFVNFVGRKEKSFQIKRDSFILDL